jgi:hypothetical protein
MWRVNVVADMRENRPAPIHQYVRDSPQAAFWDFRKHGLTMPPRLMHRMIAQEWKLSLDALKYADDEPGADIGFPVKHCREMIQDFLKFRSKDDDHSLHVLWRHTRVFGDDIWFLLQLDELPEVGVWLPIPGKFCPLTGIEELKSILGNQRFEERLQERNSFTVSIPLSTDILCYYLYPASSNYTKARGPVKRLLEIMKDKNVTHWWLFEVVFPEIQNVGVFAIPWPADKVVQGFEELKYPDWPASDKAEVELWPKEIEDEKLRDYIDGTMRESFSVVRHVECDDFRPRLYQLRPGLFKAVDPSEQQYERRQNMVPHIGLDPDSDFATLGDVEPLEAGPGEESAGDDSIGTESP